MIPSTMEEGWLFPALILDKFRFEVVDIFVMALVASAMRFFLYTVGHILN